MRIVMLSALGLLAAAAAPASAEAQQGYGYYPAGQDYRGFGKVEREYRKKFAQESRECAKKQRDADSRREWLKVQRECRKKLAEVEREYRKELREARQKSYGDRDGWRDDDD